jgi:diguanylate cyclase (GGDEF)-like protein
MESGQPQSQIERLQFVIETQRLINATTFDTEGVMHVVTERAQAVTGADGGVVELTEGDEMVFSAVSGVASGSLGVRLARASSLSGLCVRQGVPLICDDTETDPRVDREACRRIGVRSLIVVPLVHRGYVVGVLEVVSGQAAHFADSDQAILELMGGFIAASLTNSFTLEMEAHRALHDALTGLPNRTLLTDRLEHQLYEVRRYGGTFGVLFIDLDGFKSVNDTLGREVGDAVLRAVARELLSTLRKGDTLARFGGDEFVLVCPHSDQSNECQFRERIASSIDQVIEAIGLDPSWFGASVGALWSTGEEKTAADLVKAAAASMVQARRGRPVEAQAI